MFDDNINIIALRTLFTALFDSSIAEKKFKKVYFYEVRTISEVLMHIYWDPYFLLTEISAYLNDAKSVRPSPVTATV